MNTPFYNPMISGVTKVKKTESNERKTVAHQNSSAEIEKKRKAIDNFKTMVLAWNQQTREALNNARG